MQKHMMYVANIVVIVHNMRMHNVQGASTCCMNKASNLTAFCAWDSSPYIPVTLAQVMPDLVLAETCPAHAVGNFGWNLGLYIIAKKD